MDKYKANLSRGVMRAGGSGSDTLEYLLDVQRQPPPVEWRWCSAYQTRGDIQRYRTFSVFSLKPLSGFGIHTQRCRVAERPWTRALIRDNCFFRSSGQSLGSRRLKARTSGDLCKMVRKISLDRAVASPPFPAPTL